MADAMKAKPTVFAGVRFRSRLEARWAVFFAALGVRWEYEPETPATNYQADFLLPRATCGPLWVEVKPPLPGQEERPVPIDQWPAGIVQKGWYELSPAVILFGPPVEWRQGRPVTTFLIYSPSDLVAGDFFLALRENLTQKDVQRAQIAVRDHSYEARRWPHMT
jgi:hypothetical protein